jgi:hypothetical protein
MKRGKKTNTITLKNLQRLNYICEILNRTYHTKIPINQVDILYKLNSKLDSQICKSQLEKDLQKLKFDFDLDYKASRRGCYLESEIDFISALKSRIQ